MTETESQAKTYAEQRKRIAAQVKETLIQRLDLDRGADEIPDDCPLFGTGLGLDPIDTLEIMVAVEGELGIRIEDGEMKRIRSVNGIVDLILERRDGRPDPAKRDHQRMRRGAGLADLEAWTRFEVIGPDACEAIDAVVGCNVRDLYRRTRRPHPHPVGYRWGRRYHLGHGPEEQLPDRCGARRTVSRRAGAQGEHGTTERRAPRY